MPRAHFTQPIVDSSGNLLTGATVRVLQPGTTTPVSSALYTSGSGGAVRAQPWTVSSGVVDFYMNAAQTVRLGVTRSGVETFIEDLDVGAVVDWITTVKDFGAVGDGVTDDSAAIQAALDAMTTGSSLYFPDGVYIIGTTLLFPTVDGVTLWCAPGSNGRFSGATLRAKTGAHLAATIASPEWYNSWPVGGTQKDAQGITISGLSFDGGGVRPSNPSVVMETTANTQYGLVMHGSNHKLLNVFVNSANMDGLHAAGSFGLDGTTTISETHEMWIDGGGIRNVGRDGFHAAPGAQDGSCGRVKVQYAGRHGFYTDDVTSAWDLGRNHPSRCGSDMFHHESGWEYDVSHNYLDSLGNFLDGVATPWRAADAKRYGIYMNTGNGNCAHVQSNRMHTNTAGSAVQPIVGLYLDGWVVATDNTLIYQASDSSVTMVENGGTPAWAVVRDNVAHTAS